MGGGGEKDGTWQIRGGGGGRGEEAGLGGGGRAPRQEP